MSPIEVIEIINELVTPELVQAIITAAEEADRHVVTVLCGGKT